MDRLLRISYVAKDGSIFSLRWLSEYLFCGFVREIIALYIRSISRNRTLYTIFWNNFTKTDR